MKNIKNPLIYLALAMVPMLFSKCTLSEDLNKLQSTLKDSVQIYIGTPKFNTQAHFKFVDAATNQAIEDKDVKVFISGRDSAKIYNNMGSQLSDYTAKWGMLDLVVDPHKVDTSALATNPVEFIATPKLDGYVSSPQPVYLTNPNTNSIIISMTKISTIPPVIYDTVTVAGGNTDANGVIGGDVTINFAPRRNLKSSTLPSGFKISFVNNASFKSNNGQKLVGSISAQIIYNEITNGSYTFFDKTNLKQPFRLVLPYLTAYPTIFIKDSKGNINKAEKFDTGGIVFTVPISSSLVNDQTNEPFKEGDEIDHWIVPGSTIPNITKGVIEIENGIKVVKATFTNMNDLNIAYWGTSLPATTADFSLSFNGKVSRQSEISLTFRNTKGRQLNKVWADITNKTGKTKNIRFIGYYVSQDTPTNYNILFNSTDKSYQLTFDPSNFSYVGKAFNQSIAVSEPSQSVTNIITANVDLSITKKSSQTVAVKPNIPIYVGVAGNMQGYSLVNGKTTLPLEIGKTYIVRGGFGTSSGEGTLTVTEDASNYIATFILTIGATPGKVYSGTSPKTTTKIVNINYLIPVSDDVFNQMNK